MCVCMCSIYIVYGFPAYISSHGKLPMLQPIILPIPNITKGNVYPALHTVCGADKILRNITDIVVSDRSVVV